MGRLLESRNVIMIGLVAAAVVAAFLAWRFRGGGDDDRPRSPRRPEGSGPKDRRSKGR